MPTTTIYPSSHTFVSNKNQSADYTNIPHPRTDRLFYRAVSDDSYWANASQASFAAYCEAALLRFVTEKEHSQQTAQAASNDTDRPKTPFRDPGKTVYGIVLIHKHNKQRKCID